MITEKEKDRRAKLCGYSEPRRVDKIKKGIQRSVYDRDRESAEKRKAIKAILDHLLFGKPISETDVASFLKYHDDIEAIKAEAR